jgi:hypothetical protein
MKTCAICTTENDGAAVTCVACGEGSFTKDVAPSRTAPATTTDEAPPEPTEEPFRGTGGKRRGR